MHRLLDIDLALALGGALLAINNPIETMHWLYAKKQMLLQGADSFDEVLAAVQEASPITDKLLFTIDSINATVSVGELLQIVGAVVGVVSLAHTIYFKKED